MKVLNVKCPKCKKEFNYYKIEFRPFCSEKCKMIDLGNWLNEEYAVAGKDQSIYIEDEELLQRLIDETDENY